MSVEIYFDDLTEDAQNEILRECGYLDPKEGNFETTPLFIYEVDEEARTEIQNEREVDNEQ